MRRAGRADLWRMSYWLEETPPAGHHPYGELSRIWERGVFLGLGLSLPFAFGSAIERVASGAVPTHTAAAVWIFYTLVQIASKVPVSFTYPLAGLRAVLDLAGFAVLVSASLALALGCSRLVPVALWQAGLLLVAVSLLVGWTTPVAVDPGARPIPLARQVFAESVSLLVSTPMILALVASARGL